MNTKLSDTENINLLLSDDPIDRSEAALRLKNSFDEEVGQMLVRALTVEQDTAGFLIMCFAVIPKWIVPLELHLASSSPWPLNSYQTTWLLIRLKGWVLPCVEPQILEHLVSDDWPLVIASVLYCYDKCVNMELALMACQKFLNHKFTSRASKLQLAKTLRFTSFSSLKRKIRQISRDLSPVEATELSFTS